MFQSAQLDEFTTISLGKKASFDKYRNNLRLRPPPSSEKKKQIPPCLILETLSIVV